MDDTATHESGPVDAPASLDSVTAEFETGGDSPVDSVEAITQELVNEAEGKGEADAKADAPETEDDATEPADDEALPEDGTPEEKTYTVKVNGEEITVPESELLKGYSRTEDYKAKTMAVAEERRAVESERANLATNLKAEYASQLEQATNLFSQFDPVLQEARNIDWQALKQADPAAYVQAQDAVQERLTAIQQMQAEAQRQRAEAQQGLQQRAEQERVERFSLAADEIVKARPELADEGKFREFASQAVESLRSQGFTNEEIADSVDHRVLALADKARRWDAHEAALKQLPDRKVVQRSAVRPLTTDGLGSQASKPRFPGNATREAKGDWIARQILSEE